jgi:hypothetical protein
VVVSGVEILAPEEQAGIAVRSNVSGIRSRRALGGLVSGIEHQLRPIQFEPCPIAIISWLRGGVNFEPQEVAVETNRGWHVEDLQ